jgi:hypothetical protein
MLECKKPFTNMISIILVAMDGSEPSLRAYDYDSFLANNLMLLYLL